MRNNIFQRSLLIICCWFMGLAAVVGNAHGQSVEVVLDEDLRSPRGVAVDVNNNYYIADSANHRIVRLNPDTGDRTVLAGLTGVSGLVDGRGPAARFFGPSAIIAIPSTYPIASRIGGFLVADTGNRVIRYVSPQGDVETFFSHEMLRAPVALALERDGDLYIADAQSSYVLKVNADRSDILTYGGLNRPGGVALDDVGNLYVSDTENHSIKVFNADTGELRTTYGPGNAFEPGYFDAPDPTQSRFNRPMGLYWAGGRIGLLIADTGNAVVRRLANLNTTTPVTIETFGGTANSALREPVAIARELDGSYLVADPLAHTLFALRTSQTPQPPVPAPNIGIVVITNMFECAGTFLINVTNATFNNDVVVAIRGDPQSETFFVQGPTEEVTDEAPRFTPQPYADCSATLPRSLIDPIQPDITIKAFSTQADRRPSDVIIARFRFKVGNPVIVGSDPAALSLESATVGANLYYTVGTQANPPTDPTPQNGTLYQPSAPLNLNVTTEPVVLKVRGYRSGYQASEVMERRFDPGAVEPSLLGVQQGLVAGPGSTAIVPVNVSVNGGAQIRSYQFRVEVKPLGLSAQHEDPSSIPPTVNNILLLPGNDFVPMNFAPLDYSGLLYPVESAGQTVGRGLLVAAVGTNAAVAITNSATVAMLGIEIPKSAHAGDRYSVEVLAVSATSDGNQRSVPMTNLPPVILTITNTSYLVGDVATAVWYNAGTFGDRGLNNNDVNAIFLASLGIKVPYEVSDAFDAMDTYPRDLEGVLGGDGLIRFLDWQVALRRSVGLDTDNFTRVWSHDGVLVPVATNLNGTASASVARLSALSTGNAGAEESLIVWSRPARLGGLRLTQAQRGTTVRVPVYAQPDPGVTISGLQFIATVAPVDGAEPLGGAVTFESASGFAASRTGNAIGDVNFSQAVYAAWNVGAVSIASSNVIGWVRFTVPGNAQPNAVYRVTFSKTDGATAGMQQLDFESMSTSVFVSVPLAPEAAVADEWVAHFFAASGNLMSGPFEDPDGDGLSNVVEFNEGTHPLKNNSALTFSAGTVTQNGVTLQFYGAKGVRYNLETTGDLSKQPWTAVTTSPITGEGRVHNYTHSGQMKNRQFFRLRVNP